MMARIRLSPPHMGYLAHVAASYPHVLLPAGYLAQVAARASSRFEAYADMDQCTGV